MNKGIARAKVLINKLARIISCITGRKREKTMLNQVIPADCLVCLSSSVFSAFIRSKKYAVPLTFLAINSIFCFSNPASSKCLLFILFPTIKVRVKSPFDSKILIWKRM